jgi:FtsP/CotA-like multicopper oxidase with cupredoxin domain
MLGKQITGRPLGLATLALAMLAANHAVAQEANGATNIINNPPLLGAGKTLLQAAPRLNRLGGRPLPALSAGVPREVELNLAIQYVNGWIRNPSLETPGGEPRYDKVSLRSYVQGDAGKAHVVDPGEVWGAPGASAYVAPQIETYPGQTVRISLNNNLPIDPSCTDGKTGVNTPHCFNGTNLHSHGLWVNPAGNSDNVMISINPGVGFQYEYNIPPTHPAGTFWYHTHRHGSTALQVASGMAGALIVRGTRDPTTTDNGDVDTLLKTDGARFPERVLLFQQIQYGCGGATPFTCKPGEVGRIESYETLSKSWRDTGRYTSINGVVLGTMQKAKAGVVERWRMIHGGIRDSITFKIRRMADGAPKPAGLRASDTADYVSKYCTGPELEQSLIAADGLTLAKVMPKKAVTFQPAYRWDALVVFPAAGHYCLVNDVPVETSVDSGVPSPRLLGVVEVEGGAPVKGAVGDYLQGKLIAAARANYRAPAVRDKVAAELRDGLKLSSFVPHATIDEKEVTGTQTVVFNIAGGTFQVNGKPFAPGAEPRKLPLGGVEEWTMTSDAGSHPFHIHVNPFQVVKILDPEGNDISGEDGVDPDTGDNQYAGLKGVWKDTLWVKRLPKASKPYTVVVRTRYERYIGEFVLHCHILDHEDKGMMQTVQVVLPDGQGGVSSGHH